MPIHKQKEPVAVRLRKVIYSWCAENRIIPSPMYEELFQKIYHFMQRNKDDELD